MPLEPVALPEVAPFVSGQVRTGSVLACWTAATCDPPIALYDPIAVGDAVDALVDLHPAFDRQPRRDWAPLPRHAARRMLLHALRCSLAYGGARPLAAPAAAVEAFLARFGPDAQVVTGQPGLADLLDADGLETMSGGYSFTVLLTSATFELSLAIVDWQQVGLLVATDED